jgi:uncharacterized membrane protein
MSNIYLQTKPIIMKKLIIGAVVTAVLIFIWQFLSWSLLNIHAAEQQYTPNQDVILETLSTNLEEGMYFLPSLPPGTSPEEYQAKMGDWEGQPWAVVNYHSSFETNMGMNLIRGFAIDLIAAFLLVWMLLKFEKVNFTSSLLASLAVGFIGFFTIPYLNAIWFEGPIWGYLIDTVVQWGVVGAWLGWWLSR